MGQTKIPVPEDARMAAILEPWVKWADPDDLALGQVKVLCTRRTRWLLHRAGIRRSRMGNRYTVPVTQDRLQRWQLDFSRCPGAPQTAPAAVVTELRFPGGPCQSLNEAWEALNGKEALRS